MLYARVLRVLDGRANSLECVDHFARPSHLDHRVRFTMETPDWQSGKPADHLGVTTAANRGGGCKKPFVSSDCGTLLDPTKSRGSKIRVKGSVSSLALTFVSCAIAVEDSKGIEITIVRTSAMDARK